MSCSHHFFWCINVYVDKRFPQYRAKTYHQPNRSFTVKFTDCPSREIVDNGFELRPYKSKWRILPADQPSLALVPTISFYYPRYLFPQPSNFPTHPTSPAYVTILKFLQVSIYWQPFLPLLLTMCLGGGRDSGGRGWQ